MCEPVAFGTAQWVPPLLGGEGERETDGGHLHDALVVVGRLAPVLGVLGIAAVSESLDPQLGVGHCLFTGGEGREPP